MIRRPPRSTRTDTLFPYTTLFRSNAAEEGAAEAIRAATRGGVDYAFEMAGSVKAMELCYRITKRGGTTVTAGLSHPDHRFPVQHVSLVAEERTVKGSYRSEEHTSELQSLMRISYAVFCLKKKKQK